MALNQLEHCRITEQDKSAHGAKTLGDVEINRASEVKAAIDSMGEMVGDKGVNGVVDALSATEGISGAACVGTNAGAKEVTVPREGGGAGVQRVEIGSADVESALYEVLARAKQHTDDTALLSGSVSSVFGRGGAVQPQAGDYTADMVSFEESTVAEGLSSAVRFQRVLSEEDDLDALVTPGVYVYFVSSLPAHAPIEGDCIVEVMGNAKEETSGKIERVTSWSGTLKTKVRALAAGVWSDWREMFTSAQFIIERGTVVVSAEGGSATTGANVSFATSFSATPNVLVSARTSSPAATIASAWDVSQSGFTMRLYRAGAQANITCDWVAIGV